MRNLTWAATAMLLGMQICASANTIVLGTQIQIRMDRPIELRASERERVFPADSQLRYRLAGRPGRRPGRMTGVSPGPAAYRPIWVSAHGRETGTRYDAERRRSGVGDACRSGNVHVRSGGHRR